MDSRFTQIGTILTFFSFSNAFCKKIAFFFIKTLLFLEKSLFYAIYYGMTHTGATIIKRFYNGRNLQSAFSRHRKRKKNNR